ncbi:hypothetical protein [Solidesulfovibrio sp.]
MNIHKCKECYTVSKCNTEQWKKSFDIVRLENELINHRITALLATNAFLFAGLYLLSDKSNHTDSIVMLDINRKLYVFYIIIFIGITSSFVTGKGVRAASRQIRASSLWLKNFKYKDEQCHNYPEYPHIIGIRANFFKSYGDIFIKLFRIKRNKPHYLRLYKKNILIRFLVKIYAFFFHEPSYRGVGCWSREIDNIEGMSAGVIYFPNILFVVWIFLAFLPAFKNKDTPSQSQTEFRLELKTNNEGIPFNFPSHLSVSNPQESPSAITFLFDSPAMPQHNQSATCPVQTYALPSTLQVKLK